MSKDKKVIPIRRTPEMYDAAMDQLEQDVVDAINAGYRRGLKPMHVMYILQMQAHHAMMAIAEDNSDDDED